ncbi:microsomal signal peptidase 25 kDa subunit-domain-containing protein [Bisporella sp. PMI_857]|nr:microsomal signal peptidase 25 kDa subunit-domain-containing protein [Bisporella sp. PMI_857]
MASQEKISVHSLSDLKNTTDDALPAYLNSLSFKQSHILNDVRLALGYSAFILCAVTFYWDYTWGFESTKFYTAISVATYALINTVLTYWIFYVEKGTVYDGTLKSGERIKIASETKKHVPKYNLKVTTWANKDAPGVTRKVEGEFRQWFDAKGYFVAQPFQELLASNVALIGKADPARAVKKEVKKVEGPSKTMDEKWAALLAESTGVEESESPAPKGKRRGKKA